MNVAKNIFKNKDCFYSFEFNKHTMHLCFFWFCFFFCSAQRLHALQLELTSVQLLREQLEESIKNNKELRDELESEIHRAKLGEGAVKIH